MAAVTALALVNRVRRKARFNDVSALTDSQSKIILDLVNGAIQQVLMERSWSFDQRIDGGITIIPTRTAATGLNVTNGSTAFAITSHPAVTQIAGNYILRLIPYLDASYPSVSMRIVSTLDLLGGAISGVLEIPFPGTTLASTGWRTICTEYLLPDSVRRVSSVWDENRPLRLEEIDAGRTYYEASPRRWDAYGDPELVMVGGMAVGTYDSGSTTEPDPALVLSVWPVPNTTRVVRYAYTVRHPNLTAAASVLDGVPEDIITDIVDLTWADYNMAGAGNDAEFGMRIKADVLGRVMRKYAQDRPAAEQRRGVRPFNPYKRITNDSHLNEVDGL